jgi:AcrR family transcriptional regulator
MMPPATPSRRAPVQERSSETVHTILDAACALLERVPFDQITTSRIAEQAGVSVGGLYRFFADKQEIFDAIALRDVEAFRQEMGAVLSPLKLALNRKLPIDAVIDAYVGFLERHPAFRTLSLGRHISDSTRADQVKPDLGPASVLKEHLVRHFRFKAGAALDLKLRVATEAGDRLIAYAFEQPDRASRDRVIGELKLLLGKYLLG